MAYNLLKGKRGIIFGALDERSIAWKTAESAVAEGADGYLSVNYGGAALVAAIELAKVVEELRAEVKELKAKLANGA